MEENQGYWGYHLIVDGSGANPESIRDSDNIYNFTKELVEKIDMVAFGEPHIVNFGSGDKAGYTLVQLIETSNICAHFVNEFNELYLDVFSCKPFEPAVVIDVVRKYFKTDNERVAFLQRKA